MLLSGPILRKLLFLSFPLTWAGGLPSRVVHAQNPVVQSKDLKDALPPPLKRWLTLETKFLSREVNTKLITSPMLNDQLPEFTPEQGNVFEVKGYWINEDKLQVFKSEVPPELARAAFRTKDGKPQILFLVHPESETLYEPLTKNLGAPEKLLATPTASSRSLVVWRRDAPQAPFLAKLSLNKEIGGVNRSISRKESTMSIGVDQILRSRRGISPKIRFVSEVASAIPPGMARGGMILRALPPEMLDDTRTLAPLFSLYADPGTNAEPLLAKMIRESGQTPEQFLRARIVGPMMEQWAELAIREGVLMEPHAQNVMLELDAKGMPTGRFFYRDFGGFNVDLSFAELHRKALPRRLPKLETDTRDNTYYQDSHVTNINKSLRVFYEGGFLHNIQEKLPQWQSAGWLPTQPTGGALPDLHELLMSELEKAMQATSGLETKLNRDYSNLIAETLSARRAIPVPKRSLVSDCASLLLKVFR